MNRYLKYSLLLIVISTLGFTLYYFAIKPDKQLVTASQSDIYTCSMHTQIIRSKPGNCPICGMALVKKVTEDNTVNNHSIDDVLQPTDNFIVGNYETTTAKDTLIGSEINLPGIVAYDPNSSITISARISGRIEQMYVNYKYQKVDKGQKLFDLYSPELLTEQQNFIYLITNDAENSMIIKASRQKLLLYGMTNSQINTLSVSKKAKPQITIYSPASGIIESTENMQNTGSVGMSSSSNTETLNVKEGDYIKKGTTIFSLLNTNKIWAVFNVLQGYNSQIKTNQSIKISTELEEKETFNAQINFIETQLNPTDKSNKFRVYLNNNTLKLPIGLRLQGIVQTNSIKAVWLQKQAVVSIGNSKKIVFVKKDNGFLAKEIKTGIENNDFIQIIAGISTKDTIAKNAQYLIDSESFIKTK